MGENIQGTKPIMFTEKCLPVANFDRKFGKNHIQLLQVILILTILNMLES